MTASSENPKRKRQIISPPDFYSSEEEKTKLNWFCFEFALESEMFIQSGSETTATTMAEENR